MGQISPHPGINAFTYPPAPGSYEAIPSTPTQTAVSPIVTYQQNSAWTSPTTSIPHFDPSVGVDFSSPMVSPYCPGGCMCEPLAVFYSHARVLERAKIPHCMC